MSELKTKKCLRCGSSRFTDYECGRCFGTGGITTCAECGEQHDFLRPADAVREAAKRWSKHEFPACGHLSSAECMSAMQKEFAALAQDGRG